MRITNSTLLRNYDRNLKRISTQKYSCENKIYSGRKYTRASQSPLEASKALTVRKQLSHAEQYKENLDVADKFYTEAETSLLQISDSLANVRETLIYACNSTKEKTTDLNILAEQIETKAREMVSIFNTDSAERAIFGGESNSAEPFTIEYDESGHASQLLYHGVPINAYNKENSFPFSSDVFIDIGIGMVLKDDGTVDSQSAMKISFNGAGVSGCGYDMTGESTKFRMDSFFTGDVQNSVRLNANGQTITVKFKGNTLDAIREGINNSFRSAGITDTNKIPVLDNEGNLTMPDGSDVSVSQRPSINLDQLKDNVHTYEENKSLNDAEFKAITDIAGGMLKANTLPCTACRYCTSHCPKGIDIPRILELYNEHSFTGGGFIAPMAIAALPADKQPSACIACRSCEAVCPQQIKISEAMAEFSKKLSLKK